MSWAALLHRQRSPEDLQQMVAWYKIRDILLGSNFILRDVKKARELAAVCEHPDAVWLTKLFAGRDVNPTRQDMFFLAVKTMREHFALLFCLLVRIARFDNLPILVMHWRKRGWQI
jgi:hypothetical protein